MAARDAAILALLYGSGLRRAEAVGLDIADYDREGATLKVCGKGNKERLAHLGDASQAALEAWCFHSVTIEPPKRSPTAQVANGEGAQPHWTSQDGRSRSVPRRGIGPLYVP